MRVGCYCMDCMEGMAQFPNDFFDLAVVDPPYFSGPERRGYYGSKVSRIGVHRDYPVSPKWDVPGKEYFDELLRVSHHYIVWGCNYFDYQFAPGRIVWDTNISPFAIFPSAKSIYTSSPSTAIT